MKQKIEQILRDNISEIDVTSTSMIDDGYITSLGVIQIVADLDEVFNIEITYESIKKENFNSVEAIENMVNNYLKK